MYKVKTDYFQENVTDFQLSRDSQYIIAYHDTMPVIKIVFIDEQTSLPRSITQQDYDMFVDYIQYEQVNRSIIVLEFLHYIQEFQNTTLYYQRL